MVRDEHWNLFVFDNEKRELQIWDTVKRKGLKKFTNDTKDLCRLMASLTKNNAFMEYTPILVDVPKQHNGYDCGVYVCRSMEYPDEVMQFHKQTWISDEQRCLLAIRILTAPENIPFDNST
nr:hypothetical protein [Tanacetum cinerariifolium]